jgi:hypothetical protein
MRFEVHTGSTEREVDCDIRLVLLAGYTGRDQDAVRAHVTELAGHGIAAPARVPTVYAVPATRLVTASSIDVHGARTAGEAEFVLIEHDGELLIGLGSDHTDRELEEHSVVKSKQTCDKPVSSTLWRWSELADHWDELRLSAHVRTDDGWELYQDGTVADMLPPKEILAEVAGRTDATEHAAVFSGTLPLIGGDFRYGTGFRATLEDPVLVRSLTCEYAVRELPELDS